MNQSNESSEIDNIKNSDSLLKNKSYSGFPKNAEKANGRWAMLGFVALLGAYITTGQIIPGIY
tara:strand:+ start:264 stop:452 length:189 start_codon:yes stop_codon:yes gene_type:complete